MEIRHYFRSLLLIVAIAMLPKQTNAYTFQYAGTFLNTSLNAGGTVTIDLDINANNTIVGYINFTNYPGGAPLCGAGNISGTLINDSVSAGFYSFDLDAGCGFDWGLYVGLEFKFYQGCDSIAGVYMFNNQQVGIYNLVKTNAAPCSIGTGLTNEYNFSDQIKVIPNPTTGSIKVNIPGSEMIEDITIIDSKGQYFPVNRVAISKESFELDLYFYSPGLYYLKINQPGKKYYCRILKF